MKKICGSKTDLHVLKAIVELERLGFTPYMLIVPEYNLRKREGKVHEVKAHACTCPYIRRIAGAHGNFSKEDYEKSLEAADREDLSVAFKRPAQLNQTKAYLL